MTRTKWPPTGGGACPPQPETAVGLLADMLVGHPSVEGIAGGVDLLDCMEVESGKLPPPSPPKKREEKMVTQAKNFNWWLSRWLNVFCTC